MSDRRPPDKMTAEELHRLLLLKRRSERVERLRRLAKEGRLEESAAEPAAPTPRWLLSRDEDADQPFRAPTVRPLQKPKPRRRPINFRSLRDRVLLVIEVGALIGLVVILGSSLTSVNELNRDVAEARNLAEPLPTASSTALIRLELPGGHAPPVPGQEPVPALYRNLIAPQTPIPIPTPGPEQATRVVIPAIGVDARVVEGDDWEQLKKGVGHHIGSANPGERGNCVISGHDDIYGEAFRDLGKLEMDDEIIVYAGLQPYRYRVVAKRIIEPAEVNVMGPTVEPVLTLITCYPYRIDTHRIIIVATLAR